jgi:DNA-binding NarL/FixJ family response regulator
MGRTAQLFAFDCQALKMAIMNRVLLVEDDRSWQQILTEILTDSGLIVDLAINLEEAVTSLRSFTHRLAVVDLSLSGSDPHNQDGLRVLDALRYHDPHCQAVLLTGFATVELAVSALTEHGAITCLRKETFQLTQFRELIQRILVRAPTVEHSDHQMQELIPANTSVDKVNFASEEEGSFSGAALVVEDDAGWRSIFSELLSDAGFRVRLCSSVGEGLGYLRREKYALAVVDLSLTGSFYYPEESRGEGYGDTDHRGDTNLRGDKDHRTGHDLEGYRLLAITRGVGIPTIVVSGVATPSEIEAAYSEQGIYAYLQKQVFNRQVFLETVKDALAAARTGSELDRLTEREREVLDLLAQGMTNKEIADSLVISTNTVKRHLKAIFEKLDIHTRSAAAAKAISGSPG